MNSSKYLPYTAANIRHSARSAVPGYRADLMLEGILVGRIAIPDSESSVEVDFIGVNHEYRYDQHLATLGRQFFDVALADVDTLRAYFVHQLVEATLQEQELRSLCAKGLVFRMLGDLPSAWRQAEVPYSSETASALRAELGTALEAIANEMPAITAENTPAASAV